MKHKLSCFNSIVTAEAKVEREGDRAKLTHGGRRRREGVRRGGVAVRGDGAGVPGGGRRRVRVRPPRHGGARAEGAAPPRPQRTYVSRSRSDPPLSQQFQFVLSNPCADDPDFIAPRQPFGTIPAMEDGELTLFGTPCYQISQASGMSSSLNDSHTVLI